MNLVGLILCVLILFFAWIMIYDTSRFVKTEYIFKDPRIVKPFRAVVLADLHNKRYGRDNELLLQSIREGKPDLCLIAGDLITAKPNENFDVAINFLKELISDCPVCYGVGNHEHRMRLYRQIYGDMASEYEEALKQLGVAEMINERKTLDEYGVDVVGSQIHQRYYRRRKLKPMKDTYLPRTLGAPDPSKFTILLAHNPDFFPQYAKWGADLVLSGHVHGGVFRIPFWGKGVISPAVKFFPKYDGGIFQEGKSHMLLSRGLGSHTIPVRLFNPGDLIFIDFMPGEEKSFTKKISKKKDGKVRGGHGDFSKTGEV